MFSISGQGGKQSKVKLLKYYKGWDLGGNERFPGLLVLRIKYHEGTAFFI